MSWEKPIYFEGAAHIARVLRKCGLPLNSFGSTHLSWVALTLKLIAGRHTSHADAGAWLVRLLHNKDDPIDDARRRRLNAIAGTLVGNFLLTFREADHAPK